MQLRAKVLYTVSTVASVAALAFACATLRNVYHKQDPEAAAGEWKIEIQTPPCASVNNLEVIWPKSEGGPVRIECNLMPVKAR